MSALVVLEGNGTAVRVPFVNSLKPKIQLRGNYSLLYSIFRNLMDNAIAYAGTDIRINISCFREDENFYYFSFADTGVGVSPEQAMCCGIPVVTTTGTPWGVLKEKDIGWWITPSVDSIFSVLQEALSLPLELLEQKGTLSRDIILKTYSSEIVTGQFRKLYNWILDSSIVTPDFIYNK